MAAPKLLPPESELQRMRRRGMTHQEIADAVGTARSTVTLAFNQMGVIVRPRYEDYVPWTLKREHKANYNIVMLRTAARLENEDEHIRKSVPKRYRLRYESWKKVVDQDDLVVAYFPDDIDKDPADPGRGAGVHLVKRKPGDEALIRREPQKGLPY